MHKSLMALSLGLCLSACNWVQLTSEGRGVQLSQANQVQSCNRIGSTRSQTLGKLLVVERGSNKLQNELVTLARNEAGTMGGNTIVPESVISEGQQTFGVYRC